MFPQVEVPRGAEDGQQLRMAGEGDFFPELGAGCDVVFVVRVGSHPVFERRGQHLLLRQRLSLAEALGGARLLLRQLDGRRLLISTAPGEALSPGTLRRVRGEGMPMREGTHGDLFIVFETVEFPAPGELSEQQRAALRQLLSPSQDGEEGVVDTVEETGSLPPVRVPDGDDETERWDVNGADEYVMEPVAEPEGGRASSKGAEQPRNTARGFFGGLRGLWGNTS